MAPAACPQPASRCRPAWQGLLAALVAGLNRQTALVVPFALLVHPLRQRRTSRMRLRPHERPLCVLRQPPGEGPR